MPDPQIEVTNTSVTSLTVDNLIPYTKYMVSIIACTGRLVTFIFILNISNFYLLTDRLRFFAGGITVLESLSLSLID